MAIDSPESAAPNLQRELELEHSAIPPDPCGCSPSARTLVANALNAVGGAPAIDAPRMLPPHPALLTLSNRAFEVSLEKSSP